MFPNGYRGPSEQRRSHAAMLSRDCDMKIVDEAAPVWVLFEDDMNKANQSCMVFRENCQTGPRFGETLGPDGLPIGEHIAVEERIGVRPAIVSTPAVCVQPGNDGGIVTTGAPKSHTGRSHPGHKADGIHYTATRPQKNPPRSRSQR